MKLAAVDAFGQSSKISKVKSAQLVNVATGKSQDLSGKVQIQDDNLVVLFDKVENLEWASYALHLTLSTPTTATVFNVYRFDVKAELFDKVVVTLS